MTQIRIPMAALLCAGALLVAGCGGGTDSSQTATTGRIVRTTAAASVTATEGESRTTDEGAGTTKAGIEATTSRRTTVKSTVTRPAVKSTVKPSATATTTKTPTTTTKPGPRPTLAGPTGQEAFTNLTFDNGSGKCGDADGPAYMVYSKIGYNQASMDILLSGIDLQLHRKSDNKALTAYIFFGIDIYDDNGSWKNCLDAGLKNDSRGKWHLVHNLFDASPGQAKWYESRIELDDTHDYRLTLDSSKSNGWATLSVYDLTEGGRLADSVEFQARYAKKDGSNTAYLQDYALDYPDDVKFDTHGNAVESNWQEITLYNTDENLYMKNIQVVNIRLNGALWTADKTQNRAVWPDRNDRKIDYPVSRISKGSGDYAWQIDFDMNR